MVAVVVSRQEQLQVGWHCDDGSANTGYRYICERLVKWVASEKGEITCYWITHGLGVVLVLFSKILQWSCPHIQQ